MRRRRCFLLVLIIVFILIFPTSGLAGNHPKSVQSSSGSGSSSRSKSSVNPALVGAGIAIGSALGKALKSKQNKPNKPKSQSYVTPSGRAGSSVWGGTKDLPLEQRLHLIEKGLRNSMTITDYHTKWPWKTFQRGCDTNSTIRSQRIADVLRNKSKYLGNLGANIGIESRREHTTSIVEIIDQNNRPVASYNIDDYMYYPFIDRRSRASVDWTYYNPNDHLHGYTLQHKIPSGGPPPIDFTSPSPVIPTPSTTSVPYTQPTKSTSPQPNQWSGHRSYRIK